MQVRKEGMSVDVPYHLPVHKDAGLSCRGKNTPKEHELSVHKENARTYKTKDETDRDIKRNEVLIKDF